MLRAHDQNSGLNGAYLSFVIARSRRRRGNPVGIARFSAV